MTRKGMTLLGVLFSEICSGERFMKQVINVTKEARRLILSEEALKDLGVIGADFPRANTFRLGAVAATAMSEGKKPEWND